MRSLKIFESRSARRSSRVFTGVQQLSRNQSGGTFFVFVGACTAVGLTIDIVNHIREEDSQEQRAETPS